MDNPVPPELDLHDKLLDVKGLQSIVPNTRQTIHKHVKKGILPKPIVLDGRNYWWRSEVIAALNACRT